MKGKRMLIFLIAFVLVLFCGWLFLTNTGQDLKSSVTNRNNYQTYIGGVCVCPPIAGQKLEVVKLYRSKGDSLEEIKQQASQTDCSNFGCATTKEYRLYP